MPVSAIEDDGPKTELEQVNFRVNQVTDDSLESTRRMRQMCEESKDAGIKTLVALDEQGEKLDRIEEDMDQINTDMKEAEKALTGMEKCCGLFACPCSKPKGLRDDVSTWKDTGDGKVVGGQPLRTIDDRNGGAPVTGSYIAKITKDAREDEMEDNMQEVSNMLGNLKNMAIDMGQEIGSQNAQVSRINDKASSNKDRIQTANTRAQKLMK
jgi:synaptosomal-associated protein 25